jgi:hypothetical protein
VRPRCNLPASKLCAKGSPCPAYFLFRAPALGLSFHNVGERLRRQTATHGTPFLADRARPQGHHPGQQGPTRRAPARPLPSCAVTSAMVALRAWLASGAFPRRRESVASSQQAGAGVLLEDFGVADVATQSLDGLVPRLVHHLED